jgi:hypothetical protein
MWLMESVQSGQRPTSTRMSQTRAGGASISTLVVNAMEFFLPN